MRSQRPAAAVLCNRSHLARLSISVLPLSGTRLVAEANTQRRYLLEFESLGRLGAETFECLLVMVERTNGGQHLLAEAVDLPNFQHDLQQMGLDESLHLR